MITREEAVASLENSLLRFGKVIMPKSFWAPPSEVHIEVERHYLDYERKKKNMILPRGLAKAQPLNSKVLREDGWTTIGQLVVGDRVFGKNGELTKVTHLHPIEEMDIYTIKTRDGRTAHCNLAHLWPVETPQYKLKNEKPRSVQSLLKTYKGRRLDKRNGIEYTEYKHFLPTVAPINFPEKDLLIDPYVLGIWLGDGHSAGGRITSADPEIFEYFPDKYNVHKHSGKYLYGTNGLQTEIRKLGLLNNKHIPLMYKFASIKQRESLLQGLMDSDGTIERERGGIATFANNNKALCMDVQDLVRSLGGTARMSLNKTSCNGKSFLSYKVTCRFPKNIVPVRLSRKRALWRGSLKTKNAIVDIKYAGRELGRCITVESKDGCYITDDYMLTHNSTLIAEVGPIHHIQYNHSGQPRLIIILSKTQGHAIDRLQVIKDTLTYSPNFRQLYGYWGEHSAHWWRNNDIKLKDGSRIVCRGTGQQIRGIKEGHVRPTLIIGDDLEDENNTKTPEAMDANLRWLLQGADYSLDPRFGRMIVIGTPVHQRCIVESLAEDRSWDTIRSQYVQYDEGIPRSIWPEVKSVDELLQEKADKEEIGRVSIWYMERQCQVIGSETQVFPAENIRYYDGSIEFHKGKPFLRIKVLDGVPQKDMLLPVNIFMGIDPASSVKQTADYSTIVPIAFDNQDRVFVLKYFRKRVKPIDLAEEILAMFKELKPEITRVETVSFAEMIRDYLNRRCEEEGLFIPGLAIDEKARGPKSRRIESMEPRFSQKKVYLLDTQVELVDELITYDRGKHDDLLDGLYLATKNIYPPFHTREYIEKDWDATLYSDSGYDSWQTA